VKTDRLIDMLSTNLEPVDPRAPRRHLIGALAVAAAVAASLTLLALGKRHDLSSFSTLWPLALKWLFAGGALALAVSALGKLMRPGGERNVSPLVLWSPFAAIVLLAILMLTVSPTSHWRTILLGDQWLECLVSIPLIAVLPFALVTWAVRQAAPTNLRWAGGLVGLVAGCISAMGYVLHCSDDSVPFVALWYGGTIALCTLAGIALGPRLLRW
jgi:hypothetical protein